MGYSKLATIKVPASPTNYSKGRSGNKISKITIHQMAGNLTVESCGKIFQSKNRGASTNYGIDSKGRIGVYVDESNRTWASANATNDKMAVTMEVANNSKGPNWTVSNEALESVIKLCVDICKRNGIKKLNYNGKTTGNLTRHNMFIATTCPGPYLQSKFPYIATEVNKRLEAKETPKKDVPKTDSKKPIIKKYKVGTYKITATALNVRKGASTKHDIVLFKNMTKNAQAQIKKNNRNKSMNALPKGVAVTVSKINGDWGLIPSGWIHLDYTNAKKS